MKKRIPLLAVLGSAVAFAVYKMKQEEKKKIMALDQDLLVDESNDCEDDNCGCCEYDAEEDEETEPPVMVVPTADSTVEEVTPPTHIDYPNVSEEEYADIQRMNEEAVEELQLQGDDVESERPIQHTIAFHNQEDVDNFKNKVVNKGFVVTKGVADYDVTVLHIASLDPIKLMENVLFIADQAYANHGSYKGWQSKVNN